MPSDFLGIVSDDAFSAAPMLQAEILADERCTGVQLIRRTFNWSQIEPRRGGYDYAAYDAFMAATARAGIQVLPVVFGRPAWEPALRTGAVTAGATTTFPPTRPGDFAAFAAQLARRYGPHGTFWRAHPSLPARPIRSWQIWNEPNLPVYWGGRPNARQYVAMLRAAGASIRAVDPHAEIVTAGIPDSDEGVPLDTYVGQLLAAGAGRSFTTLAINPYATSGAGVLAAVSKVRGMLDAAGLKRAPIWITEFGWASGGPSSTFTVSPAQQARYVLVTITSLAREARALGVRGVVYFDWRDSPPYRGIGDFWGLHTGLVAKDGKGKLALSTYYQAAGVLGALPAPLCQP